MPFSSVSPFPPLVKSQSHKSPNAPENLPANQRSWDFQHKKQAGKMQNQTNTTHKLKILFVRGRGREEEEVVV